MNSRKLIFLRVAAILNENTEIMFQLPFIAIEMALDHKPSHRELTSVLISDMYGRIVSERDIARGEFVSPR